MIDDRDRWQSLAEELGLSPESPRSQAAAPPPKVEPFAEKAVPAPAPAELPKAAASRPPDVAAPRVEAQTQDDDIAARLPAALEEPAGLPPIGSLDPPILDPLLEGPSPDRLPESGLPEDAGEADRPRGRGGRRGQRGGRRGRDQTPEGEPQGEGQTPREQAPREQAPREDRSRRGGRGRRPPERRPEPEPEPDDILNEDEEPIDTHEEDFDDGPEDNLADLNVPPWADIIASLYRPDR